MTMMSEADLENFVAASATMLGLQLDEQELKAVREVVRSIEAQVKLVLDYDSAPNVA